MYARKKKQKTKQNNILGLLCQKFNLGYEIVKLLEIFSFCWTSQNFKILNWNFEIQFLHFFSLFWWHKNSSIQKPPGSIYRRTKLTVGSIII